MIRRVGGNHHCPLNLASFQRSQDLLNGIEFSFVEWADASSADGVSPPPTDMTMCIENSERQCYPSRDHSTDRQMRLLPFVVEVPAETRED